MKKDDFLSALQTLKTTLSSHQGHILLLIDLASCYYMLDDYHNFHKWTLKSLEEFNIGSDHFSSNTQSRAVLGLGKLLEEIGWVDEALKLYRKKIDEGLETKDRIEHHSSFFRIEAQSLRLTAELKLLQDIPASYVRCEQYKIRDSDIDYEIQSALMLCDFHMTGFEASYNRLLRIQQNEHYSGSDKRLAFFNFIFEALQQKKSYFKIDESMFESFPYFACDNFEKCLLDLWSMDQAKTPFQVLNVNRSELLSFMSGIRYLALVAMRPSLDQNREAKRKILLILKTVSTASRNIILKQWSIGAQTENIQLELRENQIFHRDQIIPCSASTLKLIHLFITNRDCTIEECTHHLFGLDLSESTFSRLRMSVLRANKSLASKLGTMKVINLTKSRISLHEDIQLLVRSQDMKMRICK